MSLRQDITDNFPTLKIKAIQIASGDQYAADEILQDGVCKMLRNENKYIAGSNLVGWAFVIMKNLYINLRKKESFYLKLSSPVDTDRLSYPEPEEVINIDMDLLMVCIGRLPEQYRITMELISEGHGNKSIAQILNIPDGTARQRKSNGAKMVRNMLSKGESK